MIIKAKAQNPGVALTKAIGGGAHGVLMTALFLRTFKQGVDMTRKFCTRALVGPPPGELLTSSFDMLANCISIRGSFVGAGTAERLQFAAEGKAKIDRTAVAGGDQQDLRAARKWPMSLRASW
ncbi:MAG: hypothetical protein V4472_10660 [Pseudomonadota bacterium]